jgi:hypothetical protein
LYYHRRGVLVTSGHLQVQSQTYHFADLTKLMQARRPARLSVAIRIELALVEAALGAPIVGLLGAPLDWLSVAMGLVASATILVSARRSRPWLELRGTYRGRTVTLFTTDDQREYDQVSQAVLQAAEAAGRAAMVER